MRYESLERRRVRLFLRSEFVALSMPEDEFENAASERFCIRNHSAYSRWADQTTQSMHHWFQAFLEDELTYHNHNNADSRLVFSSEVKLSQEPE